jgi:hemoglobin-like flavoprotein
MTPEQIETLQRSFGMVIPIKEAAADMFYTKLFELAPGVRPMFPDDMTDQGGKLMMSLHKVISSLKTEKDLVDYLVKLGEAHNNYGAQAAHYPVVGEALLWTLEEGLGAHWNDELKELWTAAFGVVSGAMIEAQAKSA